MEGELSTRFLHHTRNRPNVKSRVSSFSYKPVGIICKNEFAEIAARKKNVR